MISWFKKKLKVQPKYKIECGFCAHIRLAHTAPSGGFTCAYNESSLCPECGKCGGSVGPYNGEEIVQPTKAKAKKIVQGHTARRKEYKKYLLKHGQVGTSLHL